MHWDILEYSDVELQLTLRDKRGTAVFGYPWSKPVRKSLATEVEKPEAINIDEKELFDQLAVRVRAKAYHRLSKLSRSGLSGKLPTSMDQMIFEALKFALGRFESRLIQAADFVSMVRCAAVVSTIPDSFWKRVASKLNEGPTEKLKQSMNALKVFHPKPGVQHLEQMLDYLSRNAWFANEFEMIEAVGKHLALFFPDSPLKAEFSQVGSRAYGMLKHIEIEKDRETLKPWQRPVPTGKRQIRIGPKASKRPHDAGSSDSGGQAEDEH
ncbi:hypothetical protein ACYPKM_03260 [Pseudomonas aeruginosa]